MWVSDITYLPLVGGGWAYLVVWLDLYSRRVVGWRIEDQLGEELVILALQSALQSRQPGTGLLVHSDRGGQYISKRLKEIIRLWGIRPSMSRADDPYDNAFAESLWSRLKAELLEEGGFSSLQEARNEVFAYLEGYYNRVRLHSSLGHQSPDAYERVYYQQLAS